MTRADRESPGLAFIFPGQGGQHQRMGAGLYQHEAVFTASMNAFFEAPGPATDGRLPDGERLRADWLSNEPVPLFDDASRAQPLLFAVGHALAQTVRARGVTPDALLGHSVGELTAAAVGGVFDPLDARRLMHARAAAMSRTRPGGMVVVAATVEQLQPYLTPTVVIGAINTSRQVALSGPAAELSATTAALLAAGYACQPARALQAFHSPACDQAAKEFAIELEKIRLAASKISIQSTATGSPITPEQAVDPHFWADQLTQPVLFRAAFDALLEQGDFTFLEAGPGGSCSGMTRRHPAVRARRTVVLPLLPTFGSDPTESLRILDAAIVAAVVRRD